MTKNELIFIVAIAASVLVIGSMVYFGIRGVKKGTLRTGERIPWEKYMGLALFADLLKPTHEMLAITATTTSFSMMTELVRRNGEVVADVEILNSGRGIATPRGGSSSYKYYTKSLVDGPWQIFIESEEGRLLARGQYGSVFKKSGVKLEILSTGRTFSSEAQGFFGKHGTVLFENGTKIGAVMSTSKGFIVLSRIFSLPKDLSTEERMLIVLWSYFVRS